jgi:hypothetical protein
VETPLIRSLQSLATIAAMLVLTFASSAVANAQPQGIRVGSSLIVEPVSEISTRELWHLGVPKHVISKLGKPPGGAVGVWDYDWESTRHDNGWVAICLIMTGFGDIAEAPVAIRVWSKGRGAVAISEQAAEGDRVVSFGVSIDGERFLLSHTAAGAVFVNDEPVGDIR